MCCTRLLGGLGHCSCSQDCLMTFPQISLLSEQVAGRSNSAQLALSICTTIEHVFIGGLDDLEII